MEEYQSMCIDQKKEKKEDSFKKSTKITYEWGYYGWVRCFGGEIAYIHHSNFSQPDFGFESFTQGINTNFSMTRRRVVKTPKSGDYVCGIISRSLRHPDKYELSSWFVSSYTLFRCVNIIKHGKDSKMFSGEKSESRLVASMICSGNDVVKRDENRIMTPINCEDCALMDNFVYAAIVMTCVLNIRLKDPSVWKMAKVEGINYFDFLLNLSDYDELNRLKNTHIEDSEQSVPAPIILRKFDGEVKDICKKKKKKQDSDERTWEIIETKVALKPRKPFSCLGERSQCNESRYDYGMYDGRRSFRGCDSNLYHNERDSFYDRMCDSDWYFHGSIHNFPRKYEYDDRWEDRTYREYDEWARDDRRWYSNSTWEWNRHDIDSEMYHKYNKRSTRSYRDGSPISKKSRSSSSSRRLSPYTPRNRPLSESEYEYSPYPYQRDKDYWEVSERRRPRLKEPRLPSPPRRSSRSSVRSYSPRNRRSEKEERKEKPRRRAREDTPEPPRRSEHQSSPEKKRWADMSLSPKSSFSPKSSYGISLSEI